jgi:hypothetical protein
MQTEDLQMAVKTDKKIRVCCYSSVVIFSYTGNKGVGEGNFEM